MRRIFLPACVRCVLRASVPVCVVLASRHGNCVRACVHACVRSMPQRLAAVRFVGRYYHWARHHFLGEEFSFAEYPIDDAEGDNAARDYRSHLDGAAAVHTLTGSKWPSW